MRSVAIILFPSTLEWGSISRQFRNARFHDNFVSLYVGVGSISRQSRRERIRDNFVLPCIGADSMSDNLDV